MQIKVFVLQAEQKGELEAKAAAVRLMGLHKLEVWMLAARLSLDDQKQGQLL